MNTQPTSSGDMREAFWSYPIEKLLAEFETTREGLASAQAQQRLERFGYNRIQAKDQQTTLGLFINQFKSPIILILLFATLVSAVLQDWVDAAIIFVIVLGSALLSFFQEYGANNAAAKLRSQLTLKAEILRDGKAGSVLVEMIVPGDILLLSAGNLIPADGIVIEANDFFVNQAVLTGETFPVEKHPEPVPEQSSLVERTNMVFMGTNVRSGSARVVVCLTGKQTAFGQIAHRLTLRPPETEFERGIRRFGYLLSEVMLILVLGIFAFNVFFHKPVIDSLLFSIALAVGLTPQLLPAIININLSRGSQAMAAQGVIVRRLEAIENFGSMNVLCSDKTGTITYGVVQLDGALDAEGQPSEEVFRLAYMNAHFQSGLANPLDQAILSKKSLDLSEVYKVDEVPYDFVRKRMSVLVKEQLQSKMITKGALESVLAVSKYVLLGDQRLALEDLGEQDLCKNFETWSEQGYRVLGLAIKDVSETTGTINTQDEKDLVFVGFLLFFDPPKEGVSQSIQDLNDLGVQLKIITGDNRLVAQHAAQMVGLSVQGVLTGAQLNDLRDEALWQTAERTTIFAEVDPNQKERIILALKKKGHVVGYMGDGINDAPALHSADVGISVDNAVDVAKEAADFVLLKQDLAVLHQGILQGRKTFANTLKYIFMATSANFGNMFSVAVGSLFLPFLPMLPKQILLINFLTDLPEMTIAGDNVDSEMLKKPQRWNISFIRRFMLVFGSLSSLFDLLTFGVLLWLFNAGQVLFHTGWFVESVLSASLVVFAVRTRLPISRSRPSRAMLVMTGLVGLVTLALPFSPLAPALDFSPLPRNYLLAIGAIVVSYIFSAEVTKRWFFRKMVG